MSGHSSLNKIRRVIVLKETPSACTSNNSSKHGGPSVLSVRAFTTTGTSMLTLSCAVSVSICFAAQCEDPTCAESNQLLPAPVTLVRPSLRDHVQSHC